MKLSRSTIGVYVATIFASGVLLGVFGQRLYNAAEVSAAQSRPSPEEVRKRNIEEARARLHLTDAQVTGFNVILDESLARYRELNEKERPELQAIYQHQTERINAILTPEQLVQMEQLRQERREKQKQNKRGGRLDGRGPGL
jgi:hypothetical protein